MFGLGTQASRDAAKALDKAEEAMMKVTQSITLTQSHIDECNRRNLEVTQTLGVMQSDMKAGFAEIRTAMSNGRAASFNFLTVTLLAVFGALLSIIGYLLVHYALK